jgi:hypothetical protein
MTLTDVIAKVTRYAKRVIVTDNSSSDAVRITQTGSGNALLVEDSASPDPTPFVVTADGRVGVQISNPQAQLHVASTIRIGRQNSVAEGGEIQFAKALDDSVGWYIDLIGSSASPRIRMVDLTSGTAVERFSVKTSGTIGMFTLPAYANNAAAIAGGLVFGDVYKTATGELRIVF